MTSLLKLLATNAINWDPGWHSALRTQEPQDQAPSLPSWWFNRTKAAQSSQPACYRQPSRGWSQGCNWMWQVGPRISWLTQGLPTLSWPPAPELSPSKPVPFWMLLENHLLKDSLEHFFVAVMCKYVPTSFWWTLSVLLFYWEEIFPCLWSLTAIAVLIEDALKLSLGGKLTIFTSHQVKQLLNGRGHLWMSDQRILRYQVVLQC